MKRRVLFLAAALGLAAAGLAYPPLAALSCDECRDDCNMIPMATEDCLELYCPECAGVGSVEAVPVA